MGDEQPTKKQEKINILFYKDLTVENDVSTVAIRTKEIYYMVLKPWKNNKQLLYFYLKGNGKVDIPLVISDNVKMEELIETFMHE
jgi:hypothetical protein